MSFHDVDRSRAGWWLLGASLAAALLYVVYSFIGTFVFGVFIYYATRPIYRRLRRRIYPPSLAAAVALFALALPALLLVAYALLIVVRELSKLTGDGAFDLSQYPVVDQELLNTIADPQTLVSGDRAGLTSETLRTVLQSISSAADTLAFFGVGAVHLFVMIALAFYLLRDDQRLARWITTRFGDDQGILETYLSAVDDSFNSIFFGNILNAVLTGTIGVIAYSMLNVFAPPGGRIPAAALVGLLAGVASLIPVVGMKLVYVPVALYMGTLAVVWDVGALWFVLVFVAVSFVIVDAIPDLVLRPYVSGRSLHVGSVMLAYTFGPLLFGWYGIFLMPMLLVLVVHFARLVLPELVAGRPIQPYTVDPGYLLGNVETPPESDGTPTPDGDGTARAERKEESAESAGVDRPSREDESTDPKVRDAGTDG